MTSRWTLSLIASGAFALGAVGCGDDSGSSSSSPDAGMDQTEGMGTEDGTEQTEESDGTTDEMETEGTDEMPTETDEVTDPTGTDEPGTDPGETDGEVTDEPEPEMDGGAPDPADGGDEPAPSGDVDDLIGAICDWEFRCCDRGELDYRLGENMATADDCREDFVFELRESNSAQNDYVAGSALGLLGQLAFTVNLDRVEPNPDGIAECIAMYQGMDCTEAAEPVTSCAGPVDVTDNPCSLANLFNPVLEQGDECTLALTEGVIANDIECLPGSTCLPGDDSDNPSDNPACVQRRREGEPCNFDDQCDFNFFCNEDGDCQEKGNAGDSCGFEDADDPQPGEEAAKCKVGLSCHPAELTCIDNCSEGFVCLVDSECPEGFSCAPLTVGDDTTTWHECRELGDSASDRCDNDNDCVEQRYCNADGVCASDSDEDEACEVDGQCPEGTYCEGTCTAYTLRGQPCERVLTSREGEYESPECEPAAVGCVYDEADAQLECSTAKSDEGEECLDDYDCQSGMCEIIDPDEELLGARMCTSGAEEGDDCDSDLDTATALRCAAGLACVEGSCVVQLLPGGECADSDGNPDPVICANGACAERFDDPGEYICSDAPVPATSGGSGLTCDGE